MLHALKIIIYWLAYLIHQNHHSKVVYYHDVSTRFTDMGTDLQLIKRHLEIIEDSGYELVSQITKPEKEVMICFDDGWAGIYEYKDFFVNKSFRPTIFIAVELIGKEGHLTLEQIRELSLEGFIFECHTWSHEDLTTFDNKGLFHEVNDSKLKLEQMLGNKISTICYPMGRFSAMVYNQCKKSGYSLQYTSICGGYYDCLEQGIVCRNCAQYASSKEFKLMLNSTSHFFRKRFIKQQYVGDFRNDFN